MADTLQGQVEFNKFDLSRLPVLWDQLDPQKVECAMANLAASLPKQKTELLKRIRNSRQKTVITDCDVTMNFEE